MNLLERQQTGSYSLWRSFVSELTSCSSLKTSYPEECYRIHFPLALAASLVLSFSLCFIASALVFRPFLAERASTHLPTERRREGAGRDGQAASKRERPISAPDRQPSLSEPISAAPKTKTEQSAAWRSLLVWSRIFTCYWTDRQNY